MFSNRFDMLISKIFFKKYYFNIFLNKKYFKAQPQPRFQASFKTDTQWEYNNNK
jgi:hypothetical protein